MRAKALYKSTNTFGKTVVKKQINKKRYHTEKVLCNTKNIHETHEYIK